MIEAVGWKDFGTFFERCAELLAPDGAMLLQAITIDDRAYEVEKASRSFIRTLHLPERLPAVGRGDRPLRRAPHRPAHRRTSRTSTPHYAETLRRWRANLERDPERLAALGYDERFRRLWRLYLCYCEAGFAERRIGVVQALLAKPRWWRLSDSAGRARSSEPP